MQVQGNNETIIADDDDYDEDIVQEPAQKDEAQDHEYNLVRDMVKREIRPPQRYISMLIWLRMHLQ